jgi:RNA recognition motif-containing protein
VSAEQAYKDEQSREKRTMSNNLKELYVGSLSYDATEYDLEKLFSVSGRVTSVHLIVDLKSGEFKGCGYVRMSSEAEARDAIDSLDGAMLIDRKITVSIANPQKSKPAAGGYKGKAGGTTKSAAPPAVAPRKNLPPASKPAAFKSAGARADSSKPGAPKGAPSKAGGKRSVKR